MRNTSGLKRGDSPGRPKGSKNRLTVAPVEEELRRIAMLDPREGFTVTRGGRVSTIRAIENISPDTRACIASMDVVTGNPGDRQPGQIVRIRFWNKTKALELCAKHLGWFSEPITITVNDDRRKRLDEGRQRNARRELVAVSVEDTDNDPTLATVGARHWTENTRRQGPVGSER